jgi:hypothetical protein
MAESLRGQIEALEGKIAKLTAGAATDLLAVKDLWVVPLVQRFMGHPGDLKDAAHASFAFKLGHVISANS